MFTGCETWRTEAEDKIPIIVAFSNCDSTVSLGSLQDSVLVLSKTPSSKASPACARAVATDVEQHILVGQTLFSMLPPRQSLNLHWLLQGLQGVQNYYSLCIGGSHNYSL